MNITKYMMVKSDERKTDIRDEKLFKKKEDRVAGVRDNVIRTTMANIKFDKRNKRSTRTPMVEQR